MEKFKLKQSKANILVHLSWPGTYCPTRSVFSATHIPHSSPAPHLPRPLFRFVLFCCISRSCHVVICGLHMVKGWPRSHMCLTVPCLEMGPSWVESVESTAENLGLALGDQWLPLSQLQGRSLRVLALSLFSIIWKICSRGCFQVSTVCWLSALCQMHCSQMWKLRILKDG